MTQVRNKKPLTPKLAAACRGPIDALLDAEFFKGLCDPTRLKLLGCLAKCARPCSVSEIAACCAVDFSVVSRHLALLARSGIVQSLKQGRIVLYTVKYDTLIRKLRALAGALESFCPPTSCRAGKAGRCGRC